LESSSLLLSISSFTVTFIRGGTELISSLGFMPNDMPVGSFSLLSDASCCSFKLIRAPSSSSFSSTADFSKLSVCSDTGCVAYDIWPGGNFSRMPPLESDSRLSSPIFLVTLFSSMLLKLGTGTLRPTIGTEVGILGAPPEDKVPTLCVVPLTVSVASELIALKFPPPILLIITMGAGP
jgi:hypothetical protein